MAMDTLTIIILKKRFSYSAKKLFKVSFVENNLCVFPRIPDKRPLSVTFFFEFSFINLNFTFARKNEGYKKVLKKYKFNFLCYNF